MKVLEYFSIILTFTIVGCGNGSERSDAYGNFESDEVVISAYASGELIEFNLTEGQKLEQGELIGYVDTVNLNLSRQEVEVNLDMIESQLGNLSAEIEVLNVEKSNIERELERSKKLLDAKATTSQQYDDLKGKHDVVIQKIAAVHTQKKSIKSQMNVSKVKLKQINEAIQKSLIQSPMDAVVLNKIAQAHQLVMQGSPLFTIADLSTIYLRAYVSGYQLSQIELGSEVVVLVDKNKDELKEYTGIITWISSESEFTPKIIQTKEERIDMVYAMKIKVQNDGTLKIGMPGEVKL